MIDVRLYITFLVRSLLYRTFIHDIKPFPSLLSPLLEVFLDFCWLAKHFHSRRVSSAAADATNCPSGDMVMWRMRDMCPVSSMTRDMAGYFQIVSWFWEKPWPETNSLYSLDHISAQTYITQTGVTAKSKQSRTKENQTSRIWQSVTLIVINHSWFNILVVWFDFKQHEEN